MKLTGLHFNISPLSRILRLQTEAQTTSTTQNTHT